MPNDAHQLRPSGPFNSDMPGDAFSSLQEIESKADHLRHFLRNWHTWDPVLEIWRDLDKPEFKRRLWDLRNAIKELPFLWFKVDPLNFDDWNIVGEISEARCLFYSDTHFGFS